MRSAVPVALVLSFFLLEGSASAGESIEYKLAVIDADGYVPKDHISVARFRSLLRQLSEKFVESRQQVADMTVKGQSMLREEGVKEKMLNMMEGVNQILPSGVENQKYAEYLSMYVMLRTNGQSHREAIGGLRAILRAIGVE